MANYISQGPNHFLEKRIFTRFLLFKDKIVPFLEQGIPKSCIWKDFRELKYFPTNAKAVTLLGQGSYFLLPLPNVHSSESRAEHS